MLNTTYRKSLGIARHAVAVGLCFLSVALMAEGQSVRPGAAQSRAEDLGKVIRSQDGNARQQAARDRIIREAHRAAARNPQDPSAVEKAVKKALDEERQRAEGGRNGQGNRDNGVRDWIMRLKAFLMDIGELTATEADREGEAKAETLAERIGAAVVTNDDQESAAKKIADAAKEAGRLFPDDGDKVVDAVNKALKKVKAETTQGETKTWISVLAEGLRRGRYGAFDLISNTPEPTKAPEGSRVVMTGVVVAGEPATVTAVGPDGAVLAGTVIEVAGEEKTTDEKGRVSFIVPGAIATVAAILPGVLKSPPSIATVRPALPPNPASGVDYTPPMPGSNAKPVIERAPRVSARSRVPAIEHVPSNPTPGSTMTISGTGFSGDVNGNTVRIGDETSEVLASSPAEIVTTVPADATLGPQSVVVSTADGESNAYPTEVTEVWFEAADTQLRTGQTGQGYLRVSCDDAKTIVVSNDNNVISLVKGDPQVVRTSGGPTNGAPVMYVANRPGAFSIRAEIIEPVANINDDGELNGEISPMESYESMEALRERGFLISPRRWVREAVNLAREAAEKAQNQSNQITLAKRAAKEKDLAEADRLWDENGFPNNADQMEKFLRERIERMERLARQLQRTEESNGAATNHLWAAAQALQNALDRFQEDAE